MPGAIVPYGGGVALSHGLRTGLESRVRVSEPSSHHRALYHSLLNKRPKDFGKNSVPLWYDFYTVSVINPPLSILV